MAPELTAPAAEAPKGRPDRGTVGGAAAGALADGGSFVGSVQVTSLNFVNGVLMAGGTLTGTATSAAGAVTQITGQAFNVAASLLAPGGGGGVRCNILFLDLGPINLDLLGLVVDLSEVTLDVHAVPGPGNLLGNLLCGVAGLLDGKGLSGLLSQITAILDDIGGLLSPATGALAGGGTFVGTTDITGLAFQNGQIIATGVLNGIATGPGGVITPVVNQAFSVAAVLGGGGDTAGCSILDLDLAPIHLDLLGLVVDLSAVELDLTAVPGGGLLGDLLCGVAGLLDPGSRLLNLLDRLNGLLG